ncbi:MAG: hypothetical protein ACYC7E_12385 [Armatimonadota bacterium]
MRKPADEGTDVPREALNKPGLSRRARRWLIALLLLALAAAYWWWSQPHPYRLIYSAPFPIYGGDVGRAIRSCEAGLFVRIGETEYALYDWQGRERWRIHTAAPEFRGVPDPIPGHLSVVAEISPDGHDIATLVTQGKFVLAQLWHDGKHIADHRLPTPPEDLVSLPKFLRMCAVLNGGRVFTAFHLYGSNNTTYVYEGKTRVATGKLPADSLLTPDGQAVVAFDWKASRYRWENLTIRNGRLLTTPGWTVSLAPFSVFDFSDSGIIIPALPNGAFLTADGTIHTKSGTVKRSHYDHRGFIPPGGAALLQYARDGRWLRVYMNDTGKTWEIRPIGACGGGVLTQDGRHVLNIPGFYKTYNLPGRLREITDRLPMAADLVPYLVGRNLDLFAYPGRLVARLPLQRANPGRSLLTGHTWRGQVLHGLWPSPDGRYLFTLTPAENGKGFKSLVFKW